MAAEIIDKAAGSAKEMKDCVKTSSEDKVQLFLSAHQKEAEKIKICGDTTVGRQAPILPENEST